MTMKLNRSRRVTRRAIALMALLGTLTAASTRLRADVETVGTCGGISVTIPFTDVVGNNLFFCAIAEAYFSGLTNGTSATTYSPSQAVPREQMAAFVTRTLDQSLRRGSRRAALGQWHVPQSNFQQKKTIAGLAPSCVKSDGEDLWVGTVSSICRVRASDGKLLETWTGTSNVADVCVAGGRIYAVGSVPARLYIIDPSQTPGPATIAVAPLGAFPAAVTTDGLSIWTANTSGSVSKVSSDGLVSQTFTDGFVAPNGIVYDGANIWVTDIQDMKLKKLSSNGTVIQEVGVNSPRQAVFDGTNIWVPSNNETVSVVRAATCQVIATLSGNGLNGPRYAAFDGERILVTNPGGNSVSLWRATDLAPLGSYTFLPGNNPYSACSDGINFWIVLQAADALARF